MLLVTLKRLENFGMVTRKIYPEVPPKVEYSLTEFGEKWSSKLIDLAMWFLDHHEETQYSKVTFKQKDV
jgi:DNA-binding HxlR family transcriptional regulator